MKVALLIVDMQNGCREETQCKAEFDKSIEYINEISKYFRQKKYPVVIVQDVEVGAPGTTEFRCADDLFVTDNDIVVHKKHCNSFWETDLDTKLKNENVDGVIVSGFSAENCVLFTYNGAIERGYNTFLLQNGIAGYNAEEIKQIQLLRHVVSYSALEYFL